MLDDAIRAVGRIDLAGGQLDWVGTGWLVAENVLVTNRHVASEFATRNGDGFTFKMGAERADDRRDVDFLQEIDNPATLVFKLVKPLHIEEAPGPDVAFFEIEMISRRCEAREADRAGGAIGRDRECRDDRLSGL